MTTTKPTILFVDDEKNVVDSIKLNLRTRYNVQTAISARSGLSILAERDDVAVVISDMRMPEMDGAEFLAQVRKVAPNAVRMLLTGYSDIDSAVRAVNEGQIFRFLTKPCPPEQLIATIDAGLEQHGLLTAERVLLQKTLVGCVKALVDVLALSNPMALGRATRIRDRVRLLATEMQLERSWSVEVAALVSQLGAVSLPDDTVRKLYDGEKLEPGEQAKLAANMETVNKILGSIPRLESVTGILSELADGLAKSGGGRVRSPGARLLQAAIDFDSFEAQGMSLQQSARKLAERAAYYGEDVLAALPVLGSGAREHDVLTVELPKLADGMVLCEDLKTGDGVLILPRGFAINRQCREHVMIFADGLPASVKVFAAAPAVPAAERESA